MSYNPNGYNPYNNGYNRYPPVPPTGGYPMAPPPMPAPMYNQPPMGYGAYPPYYQRPPMYYNEGKLIRRWFITSIAYPLIFFKIEKAPATSLRRFFKILPPVNLNIYAISTLKWHQKQDLGLVLNLKSSLFFVEHDVLILKRGIFLKFIDKTILKNARQQELCPI